MTHVFISYAHADKEHVTDLVRGLETSSLNVWWDDQLPPGSTWDDRIEAALDRAQAVVVVWSQNAVASQNVKDEAHYALEEHKALPIRIEDVKLPYRWRRLQYVDLFARPPERNDKWEMLVKAARCEGGGADAPSADQTEAVARSTTRGRSAIYPAVLVLLSLLAQIAGTVLAPPEAYWPLATSMVLGSAALIGAIWSLVPVRMRAYT